MLETFKNKLERVKGKKEIIQKNLNSLRESLKNSKKNLIQSEKAQKVIQEVAKKTQEQIRFHIEDIVSMALSTIFPNPYEFKLDFVIKRNKTECNLWFERDGERIKPIDCSGGGVVDVTSLALRIALWNLRLSEKNNTIILDEPVKFVSKDLIDRVGEVLKKLSKKLGIQFIIVTHINELIDCADKVIKVIQKDGVSSVIIQKEGGCEKTL